MTRHLVSIDMAHAMLAPETIVTYRGMRGEVTGNHIEFDVGEDDQADWSLIKTFPVRIMATRITLMPDAGAPSYVVVEDDA
jgi:hypothetical protein